MKMLLGTLAAALAPTAPHSASAAPSAALAPLFAAREGWLNGEVTAHGLAGKVVVVDIFTFGCYNCRNVVPELRHVFRADRADVVIVGIHSPETPYERDRSNVVANLRAQGIEWPVAIDNSFALWNAYGVEAWPTQLFFDRKGRLRKTVVGDSQDDAVEQTIRALVSEK